MAVEMKSHWTRDLGFDSCATLPRNGMNNRHVKSLKWEDPTQAYKKKIVSQFFYKGDEASFFSKKIDDINIKATHDNINATHDINATHEKIFTPLANILKIIVALQMPINQIVYAPHHMKHNPWL